MKFISKDKHFELTLASGPDLEGWCKASVLIECEHGKWSSPQDPCLMFSELEGLEYFFNKFDCLDDGKEIDFIEPELSFKWRQNSLKIKLKYSLCPPWAVKEEGYALFIETDEKSRSNAESYIREYRHKNV
jgi:hypothetical protein